MKLTLEIIFIIALVNFCSFTQNHCDDRKENIGYCLGKYVSGIKRGFDHKGER